MKYLAQGQESREKVRLLIEMTKIGSDSIEAALYDHLCKNFSISAAASINGCLQPNLSVAIKTLNFFAKRVEQINELNYINKVI